MNDIDKFAEWTASQWITNGGTTDRDITIMSLGLAGETGEVVEVIKKHFRDGHLDLEHLKSELGDVIYYWARICKAFNLEPRDVLATNIKKAEDRRATDHYKKKKLTREELVGEVATILDANGEDPDVIAQQLVNLFLSSGVK